MMFRPTQTLLVITGLLYFVQPCAHSQERVTLATVPEGLWEIRETAPVSQEFSALQAARFLDETSLRWQKTKKCATCHTNMPYLFSRPALAHVLPDSGEVRTFFEEYRTIRWAKRAPKESQGFYPVVVGAALTFNDLQTSGELADNTRDVLDLMWQVQREDGSWRWPHCDYAPMEIDDHFGVTLAVLAVGIAPSNYADGTLPREGLDRALAYLEKHPPKSLHHRAMLAWCSVRVPGVASAEDRTATLRELLDAQLEDAAGRPPAS